MPNKAVSKKQYRFFRAVQSGSVHAPGMSAHKAGEMLGHQSPRSLPESTKPKKRGLKHIRVGGGK